MRKSFVYELESPFTLKLVEQQLPAKLKGREIYATTIYSAISPGTETAAWQGKSPLRPSTTYPRLIGYCNLAQVKEVGEEVRKAKVGDYILTHQSHRSSFICEESTVLYVSPSLEKEDLENITPLYLYHLGYNAILASDFRPGHYVAVIGLGTLGITAAALLKLFGTEPFLFTEQEGSFSDMGLIFRKNSFDLELVHKRSGMEGVDIIINTSNKWNDHLLGLRLVRKGGTIVNLGFPGRGEPPPQFNPLDTQYFYDKQISFKYCGYTSDYEIPPSDLRFTKKRNLAYLASLVLHKKLNPSTVVNFRAPWADLRKCYEKLSDRQPGIYSALLEWEL